MWGRKWRHRQGATSQVDASKAPEMPPFHCQSCELLVQTVEQVILAAGWLARIDEAADEDDEITAIRTTAAENLQAIRAAIDTAEAHTIHDRILEGLTEARARYDECYTAQRRRFEAAWEHLRPFEEAEPTDLLLSADNPYHGVMWDVQNAVKRLERARQGASPALASHELRKLDLAHQDQAMKRIELIRKAGGQAEPPWPN